ncbi:unnamed protein product [Pedinophyceae sp. YPF-701]|nr:unnamed protein product [Pedinophyceae sp. YPF-701]
MARWGHLSPEVKTMHIAEDVKLAAELDNEFGTLAFDIEQRMIVLDKYLRIRVGKWLQKLSSVLTRRVHWKRLRNDYARTLIECLKKGRMQAPFDKCPPEGPLPGLAPWMVHGAKVATSSGRHTSKDFPGGTNAMAVQTGRAARRLFGDASATRALDRYDGRERGTSPSMSPEQLTYPNRIQLADTSSAFSGGDGVGAAKTKRELEAQLGASRERTNELEWKLLRAERGARDAHVKLAGAVGEAAARRAVREASSDDPLCRNEIGRLVDKYERKHDAMKGSPLAVRLSKFRPRSLFDVETADMRNQQDHEDWEKAIREFRRQTEYLRQTIAQMG